MLPPGQIFFFYSLGDHTFFTNKEEKEVDNSLL